MIAQLTTATLFLFTFAAAQGNANGAGSSSSLSFSFAPTATDSSGAPAFAADAQRTMSTETQLDAPTTTAPATTSSYAGPHAAPLTPVTESSETQLDTPTSSQPYTFAPTTTTSPTFTYVPTTSSEYFSFQPETTTSSQQFSFQPQTTASPTKTVPQQTPAPGPETVVTAETETQLQTPTTTPEFTYAPSTTPQQQPTGAAPITTQSSSYNPSQNGEKPASQTPGNPVENHPVVESTATTLQQPTNHDDYPATTPAQEAPKKSTITGAPVYSTIHVTQASNGDLMLGSVTLSDNAEITLGPQSSSKGNAKPSPATLSTQYVRPLPPAYGSISLNGGYVLSAAPETYVTLNGHKMTVSEQAVPTDKAVTYKGHTLSMGGLTLAAKPTGAPHKSSDSGVVLSAQPTETPSTVDSGVGRIGTSMALVMGVVGAALLL